MNQELLIAARHGDVSRIMELLPRDDNLHLLEGTISPQHNSVLHMAARFGHVELVLKMIKFAPSLIIRVNQKGETPLHVAARAGHLEVVKVLIDSVHMNPDVEAGEGEGHINVLRMTDKAGNTPLHGAVRNGGIKVVSLLAKEDPELLLVVNHAGESPLSIAIDLKLPQIVHEMIIINPSSLQHRDNNRQTPLHRAIIRMDLDILWMIEQLSHESYDLLKATDMSGRNSLHYAAACGLLEFLEIFHIKFFSPDSLIAYQGDCNGQTPLHLAAKYGQASVLEALYRCFPDAIELLDERGRNVLHLAAESGNVNVVSFIMKLPEMEDLVNARDSDNENTPLHLAAKHFHSSVVYVLSRDPRVDIRAKNKEGETALAIVESFNDPANEFQKHLTLKALKRAYAKRAVNPEDILENRGMMRNTSKGGKGREMASILSVMSTLIATFTFTAAFTIPGGFKNDGQDEGMATLIHRAAFRAFVITDTIAMTSSMTAAVLVFWSFARQDDESFLDSLPFSIGLTWIGLVAMSLAFVTGLFVVLSKTLWLAILVCVIGCVFPAIFYIFAPFFILVFDLLFSSVGPRRNMVEDNPFLFIFRLAKMVR